MNWEAVRAQFPALENWTWLNTATYGQVPVRTRAAVDRHFARRDETACADFLKLVRRRRRNSRADRTADPLLAGRYCFRDECGIGAVAVSAAAWNGTKAIASLRLRDEFPNQYYCAASLADRGRGTDSDERDQLAARSAPAPYSSAPSITRTVIGRMSRQSRSWRGAPGHCSMSTVPRAWGRCGSTCAP